MDLRALKTCYVDGKMRYPGDVFICNNHETVKTLLLKKAAEFVSIAPGTPVDAPEMLTKEVRPKAKRK